MNNQARETVYGWSVVDVNGGIWWPSDEAHKEIVQSPDPAAKAIQVCRAQPMRGTWAA